VTGVGDEHLVGRGVDRHCRGPVQRIVASCLAGFADLQDELAGLRELEDLPVGRARGERQGRRLARLLPEVVVSPGRLR
jgi:hypothetical protein